MIIVGYDEKWKVIHFRITLDSAYRKFEDCPRARDENEKLKRNLRSIGLNTDTVTINFTRSNNSRSKSGFFTIEIHSHGFTSTDYSFVYRSNSFVSFEQIINEALKDFREYDFSGDSNHTFCFDYEQCKSEEVKQQLRKIYDSSENIYLHDTKASVFSAQK